MLPVEGVEVEKSREKMYSKIRFDIRDSRYFPEVMCEYTAW